MPLEKITFVQMADAPLMKMDILEWSRHFRCFPGQGQLPLVEFACDLTRRGYCGPWSLEIFNDSFRASPNGATAKDGYRSLLWLEEQVRQRLPESRAPLFSSAELPLYAGLEFIEFAATPAQAGELGHRLTQLGFAEEGTHRSKRVALWRNGGARVVVNAQPHSWADHFHQRHGVSLCAMALRVSQSAAIVERARALGYATWQGDAGPNESPIPAVCAPDGSLIYLIEMGDDIYTRDFHLRTDVTPRDDYRVSITWHSAWKRTAAITGSSFSAPYSALRSNMSRPCPILTGWCVAWRCAVRRATFVSRSIFRKAAPRKLPVR
ncbi:4-hydroxyphenylpyruvate dioxygenase [Klebsiella michiganensis]|uniref:4-hydroxyphenylpyruvate dioxygenase n=1 Tax=Klebsiella michiganensis TaxID=1134687 RepID=A0A7H4MXD6_9ENTR|nr:4-hydroxyphenylpyruvate dioxygenase [Klebsiella michiganensis]